MESNSALKDSHSAIVGANHTWEDHVIHSKCLYLLGTFPISRTLCPVFQFPVQGEFLLLLLPMRVTLGMPCEHCVSVSCYMVVLLDSVPSSSSLGEKWMQLSFSLGQMEANAGTTSSSSLSLYFVAVLCSSVFCEAYFAAVLNLEEIHLLHKVHKVCPWKSLSCSAHTIFGGGKTPYLGVKGLKGHTLTGLSRYKGHQRVSASMDADIHG